MAHRLTRRSKYELAQTAADFATRTQERNARVPLSLKNGGNALRQLVSELAQTAANWRSKGASAALTREPLKGVSLGENCRSAPVPSLNWRNGLSGVFE